MKNVYKFIDDVNEILFKTTHETFYVEFKIVLNENGLLLGEIPLLLKIKNGDDIEHILRLLFIELKNSIGYDIMVSTIKKVINKDDLNLIKNEMELRFKTFSAKGDITFLTGLAKPKMNIDNVIPFTIDQSEVPSGYEILRKDIIEFGVIETKDKRKYINHEDKFQILIKFEKNIKKVIDEQPTEIRLDRIKELMGLKIDKVNDKPNKQ